MAGELVEKILFSKCDNVLELTSLINSILDNKIVSMDNITTGLVDREFLQEIQESTYNEVPCVFFGRTLNDMKCIIKDSNGLRDHEVFFTCKAPKQLALTSICIPHSQLHDQEFSSIQEIFYTVQKHLDSLANYFYELELIDQNCSVMEPANPTFKDDYRKIFLDDRTWLHIEVTKDGLSTNIHLVGQSRSWQDKLNSGLLTWDHDKSIVENITTVFDLTSFPIPNNKILPSTELALVQESQQIMCGICLCCELPDNPGLPQPLCQNSTCGVHYHRSCIFEWLVACAGGRPPAFGVATGSCPTCLQPITCADKDL